MLLHASADFVNHFKCKVSHSGKPVKHERGINSWSAHILKLRGQKVALLMNDLTLYALIIPIDHKLRFDDFALRFFKRILVEWDLRGKALSEKDLSLVVLKRSNRSLIGCMNDAAIRLRVLVDDRERENERINWTRFEIILNDTPFALLNNSSPDDAMNLVVDPIG